MEVDSNQSSPVGGASQVILNSNNSSNENKPPSSPLQLWKQFGSDTSMHGLAKAVGSCRMWKKVVWTIIVLAAAAVAASNLYATIKDYASFPVSTTVSVTTRPSLNFPAVTVCNMNPYRFSKLNTTIQEALMKAAKEGDSMEKQKANFKGLISKMYQDTMEPGDIKHRLKDMLVDCKFDSKKCNASDFFTIDNSKYGNCYTFNFDYAHQRLSYLAGNRNGLILEMDIAGDEYLPIAPTVGLKVLIHAPNVMPFPEDSGIVVRPGVSTAIGLRKVTLKRQIPPWGSCIEAEDATDPSMNMFKDDFLGYSQIACQKTCYQRTLVQACDCCDKNYPCVSSSNKDSISNSILDCDESNTATMYCITEVKKMYYSGLIDCFDKCRPACHEEIWKTGYATASWPSSRYIHRLISKAKKMGKSFASTQTHLEGSYDDQTTLQRTNTGNISKEYVSENFARVEVYYETLTEELVTATPTYNWNNLLSSIGGQLGLWMGFSIITAIEFLELAWDFLTTLCCRTLGKQKQGSAAC